MYISVLQVFSHGHLEQFWSQSFGENLRKKKIALLKSYLEILPRA